MTHRIVEIITEEKTWFEVEERILWFFWRPVSIPEMEYRTREFPSLEAAEQYILDQKKERRIVKYHYDKKKNTPEKEPETS